MDYINIRHATEADIPFLVKTIIEAEKSGTEVLSYSSIFGVTEAETEDYLTQVLEEEIDGCELSVSSFMVAESDNQIVAALSAWVEGSEGLASSKLKGNLLSFVLPPQAIQKAAKVSGLLNQVHIDYIDGTVQKGAGYVIESFRKKGLLGRLTEEIFAYYKEKNPEIKIAHTQVFECNIPALKANQKIGFEVVDSVECEDLTVLKYLPSNKKLLLKRQL
ncbi:GNAT family N-acetyltransferase [Carboxylicivirga sp. N1Y90]|uniref:GNAT family N-acetyltransferase n=1 Tax=Carboxylicivirga fragile TaxID=3417571 RepID=UPI003D33CF81|nr:hypothetical protein [Marinilabiliaceae bacterium N1Y90]